MLGELPGTVRAAVHSVKSARTLPLMHTIIHPSGENDTSSLLQAMGSGGNVVEWIAGCHYFVDALPPAPGTTFLGFGGSSYTEPEDYVGPRVCARPGASCVFDFSAGQRACTMIGFMIDGAGASHGISAGSQHLNLERLYVVDCLEGLGGAVNGGSAYTYVLIAERCKFVNCRTHAISSPIDSELRGLICANNACNVYALAGANHVRVDGGRFEWPTTGENFRLVGTAEDPVQDWSFSGPIQLDRAATAQIVLKHCLRIELAIPSSGRPGRSGATGASQSCHVYCEDCDTVAASGMVLWRGADDDNTGVLSPECAWEFKGVNRDVVILGGSVARGYTGAHAMRYLDGNTPETMPGHVISGAAGLRDFRQRARSRARV
jgi:hypothetical protein